VLARSGLHSSSAIPGTAARSCASSSLRASSTGLPSSKGTAIVTSVAAASATTRSNWLGVRSSSP
jgi:hypothetical protein